MKPYYAELLGLPEAPRLMRNLAEASQELWKVSLNVETKPGDDDEEDVYRKIILMVIIIIIRMVIIHTICIHQESVFSCGTRIVWYVMVELLAWLVHILHLTNVLYLM